MFGNEKKRKNDSSQDKNSNKRIKLDLPIKEAEIDFRNHHFNDGVDRRRGKIHKNIDLDLQGTQELIDVIQTTKQDLDRLFFELGNYYKTEREEDYPGTKAIERTKEVFSQYLQLLIYFILHPREENRLSPEKLMQKRESFLSLILENPRLFYVTNKTILWQNKKEGMTIIHAMAASGMTKQLRDFLTEIFSKCELTSDNDKKEAHNKLIQILTHGNKDESSPLNFAAKFGHYETVVLLMDTAKKAYKNSNKENDFVSFITQSDSNLHSALFNAAIKGHANIVKYLIDCAKEVMTESQLIEFLNPKAKSGENLIDFLQRQAGENLNIKDAMKRPLQFHPIISLLQEGINSVTYDPKYPT